MAKEHSSEPSDEIVAAVRQASRRLVRELGFMKPTLADTDLPISAVHAILEVGSTPELTARDLAERLNLEKSTVSRLLRKRIEAGDIAETPSKTDSRAKTLTLTEQGQAVLAAINTFGQSQVSSALMHLGTEIRETVATGLANYADALSAGRAEAGRLASDRSIHIEAGYRPGLIARCTELHARYYARTVGFGCAFEAKIAHETADLVARLDNPANGAWAAIDSGRIVGTIMIEGDISPERPAHLRFFILEDHLRGSGIGRQLLARAVEFCDGKRFPEVELWTFRGLDAARALYEAAGFTCVYDEPGMRWGSQVSEQRFTRKHPALG
ncbi:MAG: MarR family transcriptional regulator [Hyphomicrobiales bacterium]|nr:MAG: MarR family transcriptional regulator [Hyphomicrobiales bacterium]